MSRTVLRTQLAALARRPARLLLTGLAVLVASFVVFATVLAQQITERTVLDGLSGTPEQAAFVVGGDATATAPDLAAVRAVPGVAEAVGRFETSVLVGSAGHGAFLQVTADPGSGPLALVRTVTGRFPQAANEIAVTARTAERVGLPLGSVANVRTGSDTPPVALTVTGIVETARDSGAQAYASEAAVAALTPGGPLGRIEVRLADGASADEARQRIQAVLDAAPRPQDMAVPGVRPGAEVRAEEAARAVEQIGNLFALVAMFVAIAVIAAGLVAASTFRIVFAQRTRQLALLRAVGAGRGGISLALAAEGALTGLVAGVVGVLAALAFGHGLPAVLGWFGVGLSGPGLPLGAALAVVCGAVAVTVAAVLAPALSAARVAPLAALRAAQTAPARRGIGGFRLVSGLLLAIGAVLSGLFIGSRLPGQDTENYAPLPMLLGLVASGMLAFLALMLLGPLLVRPLLAVAGWPLRRLGPVGRLAVGGIGGAPRRAAAVSTVVALGVTLIAGVLVGSASVQALADREMALSAPADFELTAGEQPIPAAVVAQVRDRSELAHVTPYRRLGELRIDGDPENTYDASDLDVKALPALGVLDVEAGSLADTGAGRVVLSGYFAEVLGRTAGDRLTLSREGHTVEVRIAAVLPGWVPLDSALLADPADLDRLGAPAGYSGILADAAASGEDGRTAGQRALRGVAESTGGLRLSVLADERDQYQDVLDSLLGIALGVVGLTVLIAVVGVGTTTALSVVERAAESGVLRAIGLSRARLGLMLTTESGLYGVLGATLGLLLGVPYAWLAVRALGVGAPVELPVLPLLGLFAVLVALTALAGVLPARRASRISPIAALGTGD
ncbi:membrane protein [Catellatospora sp. IY07-71]|uniref:FtsX-like permease family protein n=1 Tax=Catellatospora sp. IY07-71 TaxID=2728827 RepID=UPI001BB3FA02|nr:FtsX-like permease family protein [Catellatospora sp. IY07-71]BCJ74834.1 membrane protein [Catellatospora sp. IY07-71]